MKRDIRRPDDATLMYVQSLFDGEVDDSAVHWRREQDLGSLAVRDEMKTLAHMRVFLQGCHQVECERAWGKRGPASVALWERVEEQITYLETPWLLRQLNQAATYLSETLPSRALGVAGVVAVVIVLSAGYGQKDRLFAHESRPKVAKLEPSNSSEHSLYRVSTRHQRSLGAVSSINSRREPWGTSMTPRIPARGENGVEIQSIRSKQPVHIMPAQQRGEPPIIWVANRR